MTLAAYGLGNVLEGVLGDFNIPTFALAFLVGLAVQFVLVRTRVDDYVDRTTVTGITGSSTDLLVAFGIASIVPTVVVSYAVPLTLLLLFGIVYCLLVFRYLAPRVFSEYAFERGLFTWGWSTGAVAMGIALLRIVDPKLESKTLDDFGIAYVPIAPVEVALVTFSPVIVAAGFGWSYAAGALALAMAVLLTGRFMGWWSPGDGSPEGSGSKTSA